jgi:hypothetical protein
MKKLTLLIVLIASVLVVLAQDKPETAPKTATVPVISDALRARWWRVVAEQASAQSQAQAATQAVQQVRAEIDAICGVDFAASGDSRGEPTCTPKSTPTPIPTPAKK